jgi:hypothetical protein
VLGLVAGDWVAFRIRDIYLPNESEATSDPAEDVMLMGRIRAFSDSGSDKDFFAVVEIAAERCVIVPVERLSKIDSPRPGE